MIWSQDHNETDRTANLENAIHRTSYCFSALVQSVTHTGLHSEAGTVYYFFSVQHFQNLLAVKCPYQLFKHLPTDILNGLVKEYTLPSQLVTVHELAKHEMYDKHCKCLHWIWTTHAIPQHTRPPRGDTLHRGQKDLCRFFQSFDIFLLISQRLVAASQTYPSLQSGTSGTLN